MIIRINKYLILTSNNLVNIKKYRNIIIIITGILFYIIFSFLSKFDDKVPFSGDSIGYQTIAVNFAKGHGFNIYGGIDSFNTYCFKLVNIIDVEEGVVHKKDDLYGLHSAQVNYYRSPSYPIIIGLIYKIFGICPLIVKYIQLLLLVIATCFLIITSYRLWGIRGFYIGWVSSILLLTCTYKVAGDIMTEVMVLFILSLILFLLVCFFKHKRTIYAILIGVIFGLAFLTKGSVIFIPIIFAFSMLIKIFRFKDFNLLGKLIVITCLAFATILPWIIYINIKASEEIKELQFYRKQILNSQYRFNGSTTIVKKMLNEIVLKFDKKRVLHLIDKKINNIEFVFLSKEGGYTIIAGNNEFCTDGGFHWEGGGNISPFSTYQNTFYYNDGMEFKNPIKRVLNFYKYNINLIPIIFPNKIISGFFGLFFYLALLFLLIIELLYVIIPFKIRKYKVFNTIIFVLLCVSFLYLFIKDNYFAAFFFRKHLYALYIFSFLIVLGIIFKYKRLIIKQIPQVFFIVILNFVFVILLFIGLERYTIPGYVVTIPFTVYYFLEVFKRIKEAS